MHSIRPQHLTNEELLRYAHNYGYANLPEEWVRELATRLEQLLDDNK